MAIEVTVRAIAFFNVGWDQLASSAGYRAAHFNIILGTLIEEQWIRLRQFCILGRR